MVKITTMAADKYESVKIKKEIVNKVKANKIKTGVPIGIFFEKAAEAQLELLKDKK